MKKKKKRKEKRKQQQKKKKEKKRGKGVSQKIIEGKTDSLDEMTSQIRHKPTHSSTAGNNNHINYLTVT